MMNRTQNYNLCQWEAADKVQRTDFNADNAKIDAALTAMEASKGNCRVITGTYVGTGTAGEKNPTVITFPAKPLIVFIYYNSLPMIAIYGTKYNISLSANGYNRLCYASWSGNTLSWYDNDSHPSDGNQMNSAGYTYNYFALLEA
jgi:hypothetical protein